MSYFLCLAFTPEVQTHLRSSFDSSIYLTDASQYPIGNTTRGRNTSWSAALLQIGSSSASLIGKANLKETRNNDHSQLFVSGIQTLFENEYCSSLSFLVHWMRGYLTREEIALRREEHIELSALSRTLPELEEDVRYTVVRPSILPGEQARW